MAQSRSVITYSIIWMVAVVAGLSSPSLVFASATSGTIDPTHKYAWGDESGWINPGATNGRVTITDSAVTGYAWSDVLGWINLSPANSGIINNAEGDLSGYAWGENTGWINFADVSIDKDGAFSGTAITDEAGTITFNCSNCDVRTDWRPASARGGGGGHSSIPPVPSPAVAAPIKPEFFPTPFLYEWVSQNGTVVKSAHTLTAKRGATLPINLTIRNRSRDQRALIIYGKGSLKPEVAPYRGAHELRLGTARPQDKIYSWLGEASYLNNPDGHVNRLAVYDGQPARPGDLITFTGTPQIPASVSPGAYDLYVGVVREYDAWAKQVDRSGRILPQEDIFWRVIVE